ncbi:Flp pilus assembly protein CpaB [Pararhodobacter zhoushanensis]|uniref:Flp pilus assembly protein CpaB n=1 Tax=Pararhodobacter zhoushanensis TaxID=2479545 RepID=UPI000F8CAB07|nr:Flp pilus assembly protein CpaB [Pararhodobacter zhoushanensis]
MRGVQIAILGIGLALAGFGVYMAQNYVAQTQQALVAAQARGAAQAPSIPTVTVMVTTRPLRYGEPITEASVRAIQWPADAVPPGAMQRMEDVIPDPTRPRVALRAMEPMEPLLAVKVSAPGQPAGITAMLTPGMRAFTIRVDQNSGISGTLRPSDAIDIYWTGRGAEQGEVTRLLASGVRIIALDENGDQDRSFNGIPRSVTIEAEPEIIATMAQGQSTGRLSLSLVGLDDTTSVDQFQVDARSLLGQEAQVVLEQQRCSVRTRRGSDVVMIEIPCTN